jgi:hypothetical protein
MNLLSEARPSRSTPDKLHPVFTPRYQDEDGNSSEAKRRSEAEEGELAAILSTDFATATARVELYIVEPLHLLSLGLPTLDNHTWIWRLCLLARAALRSARLFTMQVQCRQPVEVLQWLYLVSFTW